MHNLESTFKVRLVPGAGLPGIFATGLPAYSFSAGGEQADHC